MREETRKLIQSKGTFEFDDFQEIIDSETKPLESRIRELISERNEAIAKFSVLKDNLRDEFAMRAMQGLIMKESKDLPMDVHDLVKLSYLIGDQMLKERDKRDKRDTDNKVLSNLENFIANCEDIPDDIKKVIDKEFFNML